MTIRFLTTVEKIEQLKEDFYSLKKWVEFPCIFSEFFLTGTTQEGTIVAATYYNPIDPNYGEPLVELAEPYFRHYERDRKTILLHEIIHACLNTGELSKWSQVLLVDVVAKYNTEKDSYIKESGSDDTSKSMQKRLEIISLLSTLLFEMWAHLELRKRYPVLFPSMMELTLSMVRDQLDKLNLNDYSNLAKYLVTYHMIRATYLAKMTKDLAISDEVEKILKECDKKLSKLCGKKEKTELQSWIEKLADIDTYPIPDIIGKQYVEFLEKIWNYN